MDRVTRFCRKCGGSIVPGARFCNICGLPLDHQSTRPSPTPTPSIPEIEKNEIHSVESISQVEESLVEEEIPPDEFEHLVATFNIWTLDEQLKPLNMKLEELRAKKEVGELSDDEYLSESARLEDVKFILAVTTEKKDVEPLRIYSLIPEEREAAERLDKLENIFKMNKISATTYSKLKREYSEKLQSLRKELAHERQKLDTWRKILEKKVNNATISLEELLVRHEIGEIPDDEYARKNSELDAKKKELENCITLINHLK